MYWADIILVITVSVTPFNILFFTSIYKQLFADIKIMSLDLELNHDLKNFSIRSINRKLFSPENFVVAQTTHVPQLKGTGESMTGGNLVTRWEGRGDLISG